MQLNDNNQNDYPSRVTVAFCLPACADLQTVLIIHDEMYIVSSQSSEMDASQRDGIISLNTHTLSHGAKSDSITSAIMTCWQLRLSHVRLTLYFPSSVSVCLNVSTLVCQG